MNCDVNITSIENVFYMRQNDWSRNTSRIRHYDAVVLFLEGEIEYRFAHKTLVAKQGDLLFLPGNLPYSGVCHAKPCCYYVIDFLCSDNKQFEAFGAPLLFPAANYKKVLQLFESALHLWNHPSAGMMLHLKAHLYTLLAERFAPGTETDNLPNKNHILQYIEKNLSDQSLSVAKICKELFISDSQLRRTIHQLAGVSPNGYITAIRLNKAKFLLSTTEESIKDISYACGFASPYYFSRAFSKATGMSPSQYRTHTTE